MSRNCSYGPLVASRALTLNLIHRFCSTVAFQWCFLSSAYHDRTSASVLLVPLLPAPFAEAIVCIHTAITDCTSAPAMAHMEFDMRPPDYEPGAEGTYKITHACSIGDEQIFHMELKGFNFSSPMALAWANGIPFDVSAVVHNARGHVPEATGTYRIVAYDLLDRHCILDLGNTTGRRMYVMWRIDKLASAKVYEWQAWPCLADADDVKTVADDDVQVVVAPEEEAGEVVEEVEAGAKAP